MRLLTKPGLTPRRTATGLRTIKAGFTLDTDFLTKVVAPGNMCSLARDGSWGLSAIVGWGPIGLPLSKLDLVLMVRHSI
jgi:hypothetical protein